ncbi:hypothetical protein DX873_07250 [Flagellimonas nanhaiensis]|uniref:Uncharacterized protein n=1 Tax=Flagellimonas nanhaiensis TaxID=2292706 RepID=A0A371JVT4_9FLAO|nr:hypothetical protein DX873_07250 [Allomuricauda nanhaiensis]
MYWFFNRGLIFSYMTRKLLICYIEGLAVFETYITLFNKYNQTCTRENKKAPNFLRARFL